jgi:hypothetical protein
MISGGGMIARAVLFFIWFILFSGQFAAADSKDGRFTDNKNGTVSDSKTGLMWQKSDSFHDLKLGVNWYDALDYAERKNSQKFAGYSDWGLPSMSEVKAIWDSSLPNLSKDEEHIGLPKEFIGKGSYYLWASDERGLDFAWYFGLGQAEDYFNLKDSSDLDQGVKLVRKEK